ncbi:AAA family ATPase [Thalassobaculum sp. OXR-137]|uniref:AAA family ATPase n=1 Tax=Thalassobaculum sp. OXR-137 TaxID=3100173 RepID=UPI002AC8A960|nr:AAA family ATPase [Thalassobaculum sp. OXR-137]WPZ33199.1 AAA family ATPase [Thalassobaculum sp. OXR-137]WPZ34908.1 AAA family ATPase [Thalassobaculum sp. OXR-137]
MNLISTHTALESVDDGDLRQRARSVMEAERLSQAAAAKEIGVSGGALNQWLQGKYKGDNDGFDRAVEQWLSARSRRQEAALRIPSSPPFFNGPTARDIVVTLAIAHADGDIVTITGVPGVGKTESAKHYRDNNRSVWLATMAPHCSSVVPALQEIAEAVGIKDMSFTGARPLYRAILRKTAETGGLLIVDEAQHLNVKCFDEIRSIHDATGIGIAFLGNETVAGRMTGGGRTGEHAQVYSRVGGRRYIPRPTAGDVRAQAEAWGVTSPECIAYVEEVAAKPGALRLVNKVVRRAVMHAGGVELMGLQHLKAAWANLGGGQ